eukprot:sb/3477192/
MRVIALASAKVTTTSPKPRMPESSNTFFHDKSLSILVFEIQHRPKSNKCPGSTSTYNFLEKLQEIDTSRLLHSKDNRLNCVIGGFSCSRSNQNVLKSHKVKTFFKSTKFF